MLNTKSEAGLLEVMAYLEAEFTEFGLTRIHDNEFETIFQLKSPNQVHTVRVHVNFLKNTPVEEVRSRLTGFRLAPVLRDLGDLPIAVTAAGCIFI